ncbi:MAG: hypothetical protein GY913_09890 [Proteobacteria bacterium]|nr:hypothetical protein [Pseudomonadota bacterium]
MLLVGLALAQPPELLVGAGHTGPVDHLVASADGALLASYSSTDNTVRVWDLGAGTTRAVLHWPAHGYDRVADMAFAPDGTLNLGGTHGTVARLRPGGELAVLREPGDYGVGVVLGLDGSGAWVSAFSDEVWAFETEEKIAEAARSMLPWDGPVIGLTSDGMLVGDPDGLRTVALTDDPDAPVVVGDPMPVAPELDGPADWWIEDLAVSTDSLAAAACIHTRPGLGQTFDQYERWRDRAPGTRLVAWDLAGEAETIRAELPWDDPYVDCTQVAVRGADEIVVIGDRGTWLVGLDEPVQLDPEPSTALSVLPSGQLVLGRRDGSINLLSATGSTLTRLGAGRSRPMDLVVDPEGRRAWVTTRESKDWTTYRTTPTLTWDLTSGARLADAPGADEGAHDGADFLPCARYVDEEGPCDDDLNLAWRAELGEDGVRLRPERDDEGWSEGSVSLTFDQVAPESGPIEGPLPDRFTLSSAAAWREDGVLAVPAHHRVHLFGRVQTTLPVGAFVADLAFNPATGHLLVLRVDGALAVWDIDAVAELVRLEPVGDGFVSWTPDGLYTASAEALTSLGRLDKDQLRTWESFDAERNRPEAVVEALGQAGEQELGALVQASTHRENQAVETGDATVAIEGPAFVQIEGDEIELQLVTVEAEALEVRANGVVVWEGPPQPRVQIPLTASSSRIAVRARDAQGAWSEPASLTAGRAEVGPNKLRVLAIGVSDYEGDYDLDYGASDAKRVAAMFEVAPWLGADVETLVLSDGEVTLEGLEEGRAFLAATRPQDTAVVFLSGHGVVEDGTWYFGTSDVDLANPSARGLPYSWLEELLHATPAANRLVLLDSCHSGRAELTEVQTAALTALDTPGELSIRSTPLGRPSVEGDWRRHVEEQFVPLGARTGAHVIGASSGVAVAFESERWGGGVFTLALEEALLRHRADLDEDGQIAASELHRYLGPRVVELTDGLQRPTATEQNVANDFVLGQAVTPRALPLADESGARIEALGPGTTGWIGLVTYPEARRVTIGPPDELVSSPLSETGDQIWRRPGADVVKTIDGLAIYAKRKRPEARVDLRHDAVFHVQEDRVVVMAEDPDDGYRCALVTYELPSARETERLHFGDPSCPAGVAAIRADGREVMLVHAPQHGEDPKPMELVWYRDGQVDRRQTLEGEVTSWPVEVSADGSTIAATTYRDGPLLVWRPEQGPEPVLSLPAREWFVGAIALSPDGARIAVSYDEDIVVYDTTTGLPAAWVGRPDASYGFSVLGFSAEGDLAATSGIYSMWDEDCIWIIDLP